MFKKVKTWWKNNHKMFIRCNSKNSTVMMSKKLFESVLNDHPNDEHISVLFTKIKNEGGGFRYNYAMFFNPDWDRHGVDDPKLIQTIPVTISKAGHVGFQTIQPSVVELGIMLGITDDEFDLSITKTSINGEPFYIIGK